MFLLNESKIIYFFYFLHNKSIVCPFTLGSLQTMGNSAGLFCSCGDPCHLLGLLPTVIYTPLQSVHPALFVHCSPPSLGRKERGNSFVINLTTRVRDFGVKLLPLGWINETIFFLFCSNTLSIIRSNYDYKT